MRTGNRSHRLREENARDIHNVRRAFLILVTRLLPETVLANVTPTRTSRAARATALGLSLALAAGGALLAAAPAAADDAPTQVHASDIAPVENDGTYTQWHQGYPGATSANYSITADGLQLKDESQIIQGYASD